ncbi:YihY/virulence factor BrkB family protein [Apibacter muscae]|uniref:YihY/virulence factor BrkB family protein n=1 Tax=Apibacter muscae TaxID=2509004 RepID=A0A563D7K8_9FLAO|nr:YihY/virulence factor BrkB family protein [Apibacter muscae]TWP26170.1 YihY/virulence factor BrkB family protein [Apibacter muscae]TWP28014.1 YihY/virulence factor BrkB family protein [Apibacter muscae]
MNILESVKQYLKRIKISSINGISLYEILQIYFQGITKGAIGYRAAAASWNVFMSFFPFLIFFLLLISYLPYYDEIQHLIYDFLLKKLLPPNIFDIVNGYMNDRILLVNNHLNRPNIYLLLLSVLLFIILSSNGIRSLITGFKSVNNHDPIEFKGFRSFFLSIFIILFFSIFLIVSLLLFYVSEIVLRLFQYSISFNIIEFRTIINIFNYIISSIIFFFGTCFLYYWGRTARLKFKEVIPGALLTTLLFPICTYIFGYYITHFTRFNVLYGSIGSMLMLMIWVNLSVTFILIGYELNIAIRKAKFNRSFIKDKV